MVYYQLKIKIGYLKLGLIQYYQNNKNIPSYSLNNINQSLLIKKGEASTMIP